MSVTAAATSQAHESGCWFGKAANLLGLWVAIEIESGHNYMVCCCWNCCICFGYCEIVRLVAEQKHNHLVGLMEPRPWPGCSCLQQYHGVLVPVPTLSITVFKSLPTIHTQGMKHCRSNLATQLEQLQYLDHDHDKSPRVGFLGQQISDSLYTCTAVGTSIISSRQHWLTHRKSLTWASPGTNPCYCYVCVTLQTLPAVACRPGRKSSQTCRQKH